MTESGYARFCRIVGAALMLGGTLFFYEENRFRRERVARAKNRCFHRLNRKAVEDLKRGRPESGSDDPRHRLTCGT